MNYISAFFQPISVLTMLITRMRKQNHLQTETAAELDALHPAILDRAFKGEL